MQMMSQSDITFLGYFLSHEAKSGSSTAILETIAVVKLASLVPQPLLSSNYYIEQVCLTWSENVANVLFNVQCSVSATQTG